MKKALSFHELSKEAKQVAAREVEERERDSEDWSFYCQDITEQIKSMLDEYELSYKEIYWKDYYGLHIDLSSVEVTDEFFEKFLTEEQRDLYEELNELSYFGIELYTFYGNTIFELIGEYEGNTVESYFHFLENYGTWEDNQEFAFLKLFSEDMTEEQEEALEKKVVKIATEKEKEFNDIVWEILEEMQDKIYDYVRKEIDYLESTEFYYDYLEVEGSYLEEKYKFTEEGYIAAVFDEIEEDCQEKYEIKIV